MRQSESTAGVLARTAAVRHGQKIERVDGILDRVGIRFTWLPSGEIMSNDPAYAAAMLKRAGVAASVDRETGTVRV